MALPQPRPAPEDRIRAALWFAERGWGIFPVWSTRADGVCRCPAGAGCGSPGKHPVSAHGFQDATTDPERIRTFLSAASHPNHGMVPPEGVFVWDVDSDDERTRLAAVEARCGPLPPTLTLDTANGQHVALRWPDAHPRPLRKMFGLVTRWGSGAAQGYIVGPRSVHATGAVYQPAEGTVLDIATLPEAWARAAVEGHQEPGHVTVEGRPDPAQVQRGGRHDFLRDTARYYAGTVRDPDALFAAVWATNEKLTEPKTSDEVRRAIGEALTRFPADPVEEDPATGAVRRVVDSGDEPGMLPLAHVGEFPEGPHPVAFSGLLGECTVAIAYGTDADPAGLLGSLLAFAGALIPGQAYHHRLQTTSPFVALVGESAVGRKGTAMWRVHDAMADALEPVYVNRVILDGLNSGEGLISALAYKQTAFPYEPTVGLVFEEEYASLLAARGRENSTLDPKMRAAFDGGPLSNRKAAGTQTVSPPYWLPALIAITPAELRRRLESDALQSGSANRWLYLPVRKRSLEPVSALPSFPEEARKALAAARRRAMDKRMVLGVSPTVTAVLAEYQDHLASVAVGVAQDLTKRLPTTAFRIALIHAMAERAELVSPEHLDRGLALTEYARAGIPWVFGPSVGNRDADLLLRHLERSGTLTRRQAERLVRDTLRRQDAIDELSRLGYARVVTVHETRGRPRDELHLATQRATSSRFSRFSQVPHTPVEGESAEKWDEQHETAGTKVGRSVEEGGRKVGESPTFDPSERVVDTSTGEVAETTSGDWLRPCRRYEDHRDEHRNTPGGWVCLACDAEEGEGS